MILINLEDIYAPIDVAEDLSFMTFDSPIPTGTQLIKIKITPLEDGLLPNVYNLCFGPLGPDGEIDDAVSVPHNDKNKVFSTIILFALTFLQTNKNFTIGLDGSNEVRAYLYHRMFITNRKHLGEFFVSLGVDWYVRLLRNFEIEKNEDGSAFFKPKPEPFDYNRSTRDLYRYYMFHLLPE